MAQSIKLGSDTYLDASGIAAISNRIPLSQVIQCNVNSLTSYTIDAPRTNSGNYAMGLMVTATAGSGQKAIWIIHLLTTVGTSPDVVIERVAGTSGYTLTGTYSGDGAYGGKITINVTGGTLWGGIRVIWLG